MIQDPKSELRDRALTLGFTLVGFTVPDAIDIAGERLRTFLKNGWHGDMGWLESRAKERAHPNTLWPEARSVMMVAMNYGPDSDPLSTLDEPELGTISVYARNRDYHDVMKGRLKQLASWFHHRSSADVKVFVDTAPVMEKPLAQAAGLGWQGKHTNLVSRDCGSWLFLGVMLTTAEIAPDDHEQDHCGACVRCLESCPTNAFVSPYQLDARRCISYLTIEHKGTIDPALRPLMGNRIYGCDDCLAVCPWNKFASGTDEPKLQAREDLAGPLLRNYALLDDSDFRQLFAGSPIKRIGRNRFLRNVLIAIGNSGQSGLADAAVHNLNDDSPLVRAMAVWATSRLLTKGDWQALRARYVASENDSGVLAEWSEGC